MNSSLGVEFFNFITSGRIKTEDAYWFCICYPDISLRSTRYWRSSRTHKFSGMGVLSFPHTNNWKEREMVTTTAQVPSPQRDPALRCAGEHSVRGVQTVFSFKRDVQVTLFRNFTFFGPCIIVWTCINHQLNAQFLYSFLITSVTLHSSTCFEHRCAHPQEEPIIVFQCDNTRYCRHTIFVPPEDEHIDARNMFRSVV